MPALSSHLNVFNTAILIIMDKGYRYWVNDDETYYYAEKEVWDFMADDPIQLLGLISIYESQNPKKYEDYWWRRNQGFRITFMQF